MQKKLFGIPWLLLVPYFILLLIAIWALRFIGNAASNYKSINTYWLESFPSLFTTIGVFGTFLGIVLGLQDFNTGVFDRGFKIAQTDKITTLITGATGTGKEILAKYIHEKSARKHKKFLAINCSSLTDTPLESRLFGHL